MLSTKQVTRRIVSYSPLSSFCTVFFQRFQLSTAVLQLPAGNFQLLTDVANPRTEFARTLGKRLVFSQQMCIGSQHRAATAGIGNNWNALHRFISLASVERGDVSAG